MLPRPVGRHWRSALQIAPVRQLAPRQQRRAVQPKAVFPAPAGAPDYAVAGFPPAGAGAVVSVASVAARVARAGLPAVATSAAERAAATDRCAPGAVRSGAKACRAGAPAWFAAAAGCAARAGRSAPVAVGARSERAVRSGATVRRFSAWPGATVQRFAASDAAPWPDAVAAEPDGTPVRRAAPLPEAVQGGPWRGVAQDGPLRAPAQDGPWRAAVPRVGPRPQAVRVVAAAGQTRPRLPRPPKRREEML